MKLFSGIKESSDPAIIIDKCLKAVVNRISDDLDGEGYNWTKPWGVKRFESIILAKFMLDYSFNGLAEAKLQDDERFKSRVLPALDPIPDRRVLMPELYNEKWLLTQQKARPKSFASEFMLIPHFSTESYFENEDIEKNDFYWAMDTITNQLLTDDVIHLLYATESSSNNLIIDIKPKIELTCSVAFI